MSGMFLMLLFLVPGMLLGMWAQWRVKSAYSAASQVPAEMSGAAAARTILDHHGLHDVDVELVDGFLSDHYDPGAKVLRLSNDVFHGHTAAAVGIAAHEVGHAMQDAFGYSLMRLRGFAVPLASIGGGIGAFVVTAALFMRNPQLLFIGIALYSGVVIFQLVNLPVEFDASNRAKKELVYLGMAGEEEMYQVRSVLNAAAWTYVAATLSAIMELAYYIFIFLMQTQRSNSDE